MKRYILYMLLLAVGTTTVACGTDEEDLLAPAMKNGQWGFINTKGEWVIKPERPYPTQFNDGLAPVTVTQQPDKKDLTAPPVVLYGFMNPKGAMEVTAAYMKAGVFSSGLGLIPGEKGVQYIDKKGETVLSLPYAYAQPFVNGYAVVGKELNGKRGLIDREGRLVVPIQYDGVNDVHNGLAVVYRTEARGDSTGRKRYKWGAVNEKGEVVIPLKYGNLGTEFREGKTRFNNGHLFGYLSSEGEVVIQPQYRFARNFRGDRAPVLTFQENGDGLKWGLINEKGELIVPAVFDYIDTRGYKHSGLILVGRRLGTERRMGFIDKDGKVVIPLEYPLLDVFYEGLALAMNEQGKFGWIDTEGKWVVKPTFDKGSQFVNPHTDYLSDDDYLKDN